MFLRRMRLRPRILAWSAGQTRFCVATSKRLFQTFLLLVGVASSSYISSRRREKALRWSKLLVIWRSCQAQPSFIFLAVGDAFLLTQATDILKVLASAFAPVHDRADLKPVAEELEAMLAHVVNDIVWAHRPCCSGHDIATMLGSRPSSSPGPDGVSYMHVLRGCPSVHELIARELLRIGLRQVLGLLAATQVFLSPFRRKSHSHSLLALGLLLFQMSLVSFS